MIVMPQLSDCLYSVTSFVACACSPIGHLWGEWPRCCVQFSRCVGRLDRQVLVTPCLGGVVVLAYSVCCVSMHAVGLSVCTETMITMR